MSLSDLASQTLGEDVGSVVNGNVLLDPTASLRFFLSIASTGQVPSINPAVSTDQIAKFVSEVLNRTRGAGGAIGASKESVDMKEILEGLKGLSEEESVVMQATAGKVVGRLVDSLIDRLQPLVQK